MGVDTYLYLINRPIYYDSVVPALNALLEGSDILGARDLFQTACSILAAQQREFPWSPLHRIPDQLEEGLKLIDGNIPETYYGDHSPLGPDGIETLTDPAALVRRYHLMDSVCGIVVEGVSVPWDLPFPPIHAVTQGWVQDLYEASRRFEDVFCNEVYTRSRPALFSIALRDEIIDREVIRELFAEISKISSPDHARWREEYFKNLYLLLERGCDGDYEVMAAYY